MSFVQWDTSMAVGVPRIDDQHRELIAVINDLALAFNTESQHETVAKSMDTLLRYTREHLRDEEALMREQGYPEAERHAGEHKAFEDALAGLERDRAGNEMETLNKMFFFLTSWLVNHICMSDQKVGAYIGAGNKSGCPASGRS